MIASPSSGREWDVVVVGAGPAGAWAARAAAQAGRTVLLLERASIPRYKTCGGGLAGGSLAELPPEVKLDVKDEVNQVTLSWNGRRERTLPSAGPTAKMVFRSDFDAALTDAAAAAGAVVWDRTVVQRIEATDHTVILGIKGGDRIRARAVVGADGSASRLATFVGVRYRQVDLALELELPIDARMSQRWQGRALLEWGPFPGSLGWVFPKGDVSTVGVVGSRGQPDLTRTYLQAFLDRYEFSGLVPIHDTGHLTRCREVDSPLVRDRVLVAGDAAGLLDPWLREGISFALRSGSLAGNAAAEIAAADTTAKLCEAERQYTESVCAGMGAEMAASQKLSKIFARRPGLVHTAITRVPGVWPQIDAYLTGKTSIPDIVGAPAIRPLVTAAAALS